MFRLLAPQAEKLTNFCTKAPKSLVAIIIGWGYATYDTTSAGGLDGPGSASGYGEVQCLGS